MKSNGMTHGEDAYGDENTSVIGFDDLIVPEASSALV
jgi:hypothetical protein